ncbi:uncharacterized protein JCM6883_007067 [Sporobolomyces salmoneus]|uniref:uncharacterized protein n=1 Tax=Sporobolomyces salmoneus TaxID=183962 RepID=UPI0031738D62
MKLRLRKLRLSDVRNLKSFQPPLIVISILKATLALSILLILTYSNHFASLSPHPVALNGAVLVIVGAYPGSPMGKCFQAVLLGTAGLALGVLCYAILGEAGNSATGQGFIFAMFCYFLALVRYSGAKYISFYLYGILFAFGGIYYRIESRTKFDKSWFLANFQAYAWGIAISLAVNVFAYPVTSERELKKLLVTSLQHVSTLAHLSCKTYAKEITEDEAEVRQLLVKTIRSDYLALAARFEETSLEIAFTRWSLKHYRDMISSVQGLQQALLTSSSALDLIDRLDPEGVNVKRHLLARVEVAKTFTDFRHGIDLVIAEIIDELEGRRRTFNLSAANRSGGGEGGEGGGELTPPTPGVTSGQVTPHGDAQTPAEIPPKKVENDTPLYTTKTTLHDQKKLETVAAKLKREVQRSRMRHEEIRSANASLRSLHNSPSRRGWSPAGSRRGSPVASPTSSRPQSSSFEIERGRWGAFKAVLEEKAKEREKEENDRSRPSTSRRWIEEEREEEPIPGELSKRQEEELEKKEKAKLGKVTTDPNDARDEEDSVLIFRKAWDAFAQAQSDALVSLIKDGALEVDDELRIDVGMPSLKTMYAHRQPKAWTSSLLSSPMTRRRSGDSSHSVRFSPTIFTASEPSVRETPLSPTAQTIPETVEEEGEDGEESSESDPDEEDVAPCSEALTKSYSLLFGLGQLTDELCRLHDVVTLERPVLIRPFILQTLVDFVKKLWAPKDGMSLQEALSTLYGREYRPVKRPWIHKLADGEKWLRSQRSIYAFKVAAGASVYTVFALAPTLQDQVYLRIGMLSSLITVVVAIQPTLGGTISTWLLQLSGTGAGALFGLITLEIFNDVGGYRFNPYGLVSFGAIWFAVASYFFYSRPAWYTAGLLLQTGYGAMVIQEYVYNEIPGSIRPYDSPPLRFGYTIASLAISIGISAFFQLFILRQPARHRLRLQLASVTFALSSYNSVFQVYVNSAAPIDESPTPPPEALASVFRELVKREKKIQADILALAPTFEFAKVEPKFLVPFNGPVLLRIIRSLQVILDRLREARTAIGTAGFNETIHREFASVLYPYRLHSQRLTRTLFYLGATSLLSKTQLARDVPSSKSTWLAFERDALVLSRRMSNRPNGDMVLKHPAFLRYWFFLVSLGSVSSELEELEKHLGELFGDPDLHHPAIY